MLFKYDFLNIVLYVAVGLTTIHLSLEKPEAQYKEDVHPTVLAVVPYDADKINDDANKLKEALKHKLKCNETAIISILAHRSYDQRNLIAAKYKDLTKKELQKKLRDKLYFKFKDVILALMNPYEFVAGILDAAIRGRNSNDSDIIHIVCTATNSQMEKIKHAYKKKFNVDLDKNIYSGTKRNFRTFLLALIEAKRNEDPNNEVDTPAYNADWLYRAGEVKNGFENIRECICEKQCEEGWKTEVFIDILSKRNVYHLQQVFTEYRINYKNDIENVIEIRYEGSLKEAFLTVVQFVKDKHKYFATFLYKSMMGFLKKHNYLISIIVTRCEIDMVEIKKAFYNEYMMSLDDFIKKNTSGQYRKCLQELIKD